MQEGILETPLLDEIDVAEWFNATYNEGQQLEVESCIENHVWITATKQKMLVREMKTSHIKNCIRCWDGKGKSCIPAGYLGGKAKWLEIFNKELLNRQ
jgi:hypothetical protein